VHLCERGRKPCHSKCVISLRSCTQTRQLKFSSALFCKSQEAKDNINAKIQRGADHLLDEEINSDMIWKSPFQSPQRIIQRIWEKQADMKKGATQSAQNLSVICPQQGPGMGADARI